MTPLLPHRRTLAWHVAVVPGFLSVLCFSSGSSAGLFTASLLSEACIILPVPALMLLATSATNTAFNLLRPVLQSLPTSSPQCSFLSAVRSQSLSMLEWRHWAYQCVGGQLKHYFAFLELIPPITTVHLTLPVAALSEHLSMLSSKERAYFFPWYLLLWSHSRNASIREIEYQISAIHPQQSLSVCQWVSVQWFVAFVCLLWSPGRQKPAQARTLRALVATAPSGAMPSLLLMKNQCGTWTELRKVIITWEQ